MSDDFELGPLADVSREIGEHTATLIFTRTLRHTAERVWRALIEPTEQLEWMPFVADRPLEGLGPAKLRMTDGSMDAVMLEGEVLKSEHARLLVYRWGNDLLSWELSSKDGHTILTLRHTTMTPDRISSFAAGWHVCIAVLDRFLEGRPVGRIVGKRALDIGALDLKSQYHAQLSG